jgi:hypothetical protein
MASCVYAPKKGVKTFYKLKSNFGYSSACKIYNISTNPKFIQDFKDTLSLDAEGVPTYASLMKNSVIKNFLGKDTVIRELNKHFPKRDDTIDNYKLALVDALNFNRTDENSDKYVATVETNDDGKIAVSVKEKTAETAKEAAGQQATRVLNDKIVSILEPLGVNIGMLTDEEVGAGRVGVTDFSTAKRIAEDIVSMIKLANNTEGYKALSEEFSHLIIGAMRTEPLISRSIKSLADNPDVLMNILGEDDYYDTLNYYEGYDNAMQLVAEEALGRLLQTSLKEQLSEKTQPSNLLRRAFNYIVNKFKKMNFNDVERSISDAQIVMNTMAEKIMSGTFMLSKENIAKSQREASFNALSKKIQRNIDILNNAINTEVKRYKITNPTSERKEAIKKDIDALKKQAADKEHTVLGLLNYAKQAVDSFKSSSLVLDNIGTETDIPKKFKTLRGIRVTIDSYSKFIKELNDAYNEETDEDSDFKKEFTVETPLGKEVLNMSELIKDLNTQSQLLTSKYLKTVLPAFAQYLEPILGKKIATSMKDSAGNEITVEELLTKASSDISFLDRWLDSMADSSDVLLQAFDEVYKRAVDKSRLESIKEFKEIQALRQEAESYGITSYEWMFERDKEGNKTGNYISEINSTQYYKDLKDESDKLDKKYGKNPTDKDKVSAKAEERKAWLREHAVRGIDGRYYANPRVYHNRDFNKLTAHQKIIWKKFLEFKAKHDIKYSEDTNNLKAIQIRKDGIQRFIDSASSPSSIWTNIKDNIASTFLERADDDSIYGDKSRRGLTDFNGKEFMVLPKLYTNSLENSNELSTDIFGTLIAYTASTNNYEELDKIVDPLETGRTLVQEARQVQSTRGNKIVNETFKAAGVEVKNTVFDPKGTNIEKKLNDFMESQIYHKYLKDSGTFDVFKKAVNKNKLTSWFLGLSSTAQLGFNFLANEANVATGVSMQNIEAAAGEYFTAKELLIADKEYTKYIGAFVSELGSRNKKSKLALFDELFDIRQNFSKSGSHKNMRSNWVARLFGEDIQFIGQDGGDHWLYNRTAIAMAKHEKVKVPGKGTISLWDALTISNVFKDNNSIKQMTIPEGTTTANGELFDIHKFTRKVAHVNQTLFGIYNDEDRMAANRVIMGRLIMQYRKWMKPQFNKRFQKAQYSISTEQWEEGYYVTFAKMINNLVRGKVQLGEQWHNMSNHEKANIKRVLAEVAQFFAVWLLANIIEWPDDKKRPWAMKFAEYSSKRLVHELGNLTPSTTMANEILKTVQSPAASISMVNNIVNLIGSAIDPRDWTNEISTGPYKGYSTFEKNLYRAPIPGVMQYKQVDKFVNEIDNSIQFYARPSGY